MSNFFLYGQIIIFLFIFIQDFIERKVFLLTFIVSFIFGCLLLMPFNTSSFVELIPNFAIIIILTTTLYVYCLVRKINLRESFGLGDFLFFCIIAISFPQLSQFIVVLCFSFLFALISHLVLKNLPSQKKKNHVPLAGYQALYCSGALIYNHLL